MTTRGGGNANITEEMERLRLALAEANMTLEAIRTGQVDALLVESSDGPQLYTLNSADQTYRFFIEQMKEGAITLDAGGLILFSNSQFAKMVDDDVSNLVGKKLIDFIAGENLDRFRQMQAEAWENNCKGEFLLFLPRRRIPVQLSMTPLALGQGISLSVLITDLTEQKLTENALKQSNEKLTLTNLALEASNHDLQQFASVASHDLQEPVRKIQIFSMMLRDKEQNLSPAGMVYLDKVIMSAERMKMLIVDILNYSGLSSNETRFTTVSLKQLIASLLDDFELLIGETGAVISVSDLPEIQANAGQIRQVLQNLLSNALKFVRPGIRPEIVIRCRRIAGLKFKLPASDDGMFREISVADNGIGFEEIYAENIFSLFERLNGKDKFEGTGIGLAIAKKIIEKHGGIIMAEGTPGKGSVFSFIIPVVPIKIA